MALIRIVGLLACLALAVHAASEPQVATSGGSLIFTSADKKDISFQPGSGGSLYLNGVQIKTVADLKGAKGDAGNQGDVGLTGPKGDAGTAGQNGSKGTTGAQGLKGGAGTDGAMGAKGAMGVSGKDGANGVDGAKGGAGVDGKNGLDGSQGQKGDNGQKGDVGRAGPAGATGSSVCDSLLLPTCPFWLNVNTSSLQANTPRQALRVATGGMAAYYHPAYEASYKCRFEGLTSKRVMYSEPAALMAVIDNMTGKPYYVIDCLVPTWNLRQSAASPQVIQETANVTVWFQDKREITFAGQGVSNQVTFSLGWDSAVTQADGSVLIMGVGFNTTASFLCRFRNISALGVDLHVNATVQLALNSSAISCRPPHWNFTKDSRTSLIATVTIFEEDHVSKAVLYEVPFRGRLKIDNLYTYYRCRDGVANGVESDVDCGGLCPNLCPSLSKCKVNSDCVGGVCAPNGRCGIRGQSQSNPALSCKTIQYNSSGIAWIKWAGATGGAVQTYCLLDKAVDGGGWTMVWKHSYFEVPKSRLNDMRSYSTFYQPCLGIPTTTGFWCNIPKKQQTGYTEQMVTAYHKGKLVYAYKAPRNSQLGVSNSGVFLTTTNKVYDICRSANGVRPSYSTNSAAESGITFDKTSPTNFNSNCDTDWSNYATDCRWENCNLPTSVSSSGSHVQMTVIIYIR